MVAEVLVNTHDSWRYVSTDVRKTDILFFFMYCVPGVAACSGTWTRLDKALCMDMNNNVCKGLSTLVPGPNHFPGHTAGSCGFSSREEAGLSYVGFPGEGLVCAPVMMGEQAIVEGLCQ